MFTYRLAAESDREIWIKLNREFMAEEIQDADLWNNTGETGDEQFAETFRWARASEDMIRLMLFEEKGKVIGFANLLLFSASGVTERHSSLMTLILLRKTGVKVLAEEPLHT